MNGIEVFNHPGCPWSEYELANLVSCEERICSWVRQPLNTYSNIGLFIVAIYLFKLWTSGKRKSDFDFGLIALFIGASSTIAHAAQTRFFVFFDYSSQFVLFSYLISFSLHRYRPFRKIWRWRVTILLIALSTLPQIFNKKSGIYVFAIMALIFLYLEWLNLKGKGGIHYKDLYTCLTFFGLAFSGFVLDSTHLICFPENHFFQLHAFWHIFVAVSLFYLAKFYSQFSYLIQVDKNQLERNIL